SPEAPLCLPRSSSQLRPTTTSTLFPYTTLFRSGRRAGVRDRCGHRHVSKRKDRRPKDSGGCGQRANGHRIGHSPRDRGISRDRRSEEHTSELQSPYDLVCRLLLGKKKINYAVFCLKKKTERRSADKIR